MKKKKGFTLVELLAVIVILAVILIIAVPRISEVINNSKKASFEATAKTIANQAEKKYMENEVLGKTGSFECSDIVKLNNTDYASCTITFDTNGNATVTLNGSGKFAGLTIRNATKNSATATELTATDSKYFSYEVKIDGLTDDKSKIYDVTVLDQGKCKSYLQSKFDLLTEEKVTAICTTNQAVSGLALQQEVSEGTIPSSDYETAGLKVDIYNKSVDVIVADQSKCVAYMKNMGGTEELATTACSGGVINGEGNTLVDLVKNDDIPASDYETAGLNVKDVYKWYDTNEVTVSDQNKCVAYYKNLGETEEDATTFCNGGVINGDTLANDVKNGYIPASHYEAAGLKVTSKVYDKSTITITGYNVAGGLDVVIPSMIDGKKVVAIANNAFENKGIKSVVIPDAVKTIGDCAFSYNKLTSIVIPSSVTYIGVDAFSNNQINDITFPTTPITITDSTFYDNPITNSETYTYPDNVTVIIEEPS